MKGIGQIKNLSFNAYFAIFICEKCAFFALSADFVLPIQIRVQKKGAKSGAKTTVCSFLFLSMYFLHKGVDS